MLSTSLGFDVQLPNGQSTRHSRIDQSLAVIRERLTQSIKIYEKQPLGNIFLFLSNVNHL